jgi:hypothetical protein
VESNYVSSAMPWLASACPVTALPSGAPATLLVHGAARLRQEKPVCVQIVFSPKSALLGFGAADGGFAADGPAVMRPSNVTQPAGTAERVDTQSKHIANGGLRGSHPWRRPVIP